MVLAALVQCDGAQGAQIIRPAEHEIEVPGADAVEHPPPGGWAAIAGHRDHVVDADFPEYPEIDADRLFQDAEEGVLGRGQEVVRQGIRGAAAAFHRQATFQYRESDEKDERNRDKQPEHVVTPGVFPDAHQPTCATGKVYPPGIASSNTRFPPDLLYAW